MDQSLKPTEQFQTAWRRLVQHWQESETGWNDDARRNFERQHWLPLEKESAATLKEAERLAQVLSHIQRSVK